MRSSIWSRCPSISMLLTTNMFGVVRTAGLNSNDTRNRLIQHEVKIDADSTCSLKCTAFQVSAIRERLLPGIEKDSGRKDMSGLLFLFLRYGPSSHLSRCSPATELMAQPSSFQWPKLHIQHITCPVRRYSSTTPRSAIVMLFVLARSAI